MDFDDQFLFKACCLEHFRFPTSYNNNSKIYNAHILLIQKEPENIKAWATLLMDDV